ncbi:fumarylacetoacetate hydrolase family protein [Blastococcus xanthinilyticus]|uniref:2-keto-4-pentenoate hydratase/2-oxohepta-3-ene-1,7-dioic acid hydratase in catechol pathway n=1 Tax=Blastococcus xanthinilyticus TaxID=1564164 RepID=A0A5S5D5Z7_9ACTN|nr:fumarylacetoacetate hydrolase family protein [Blastococcus xanthinilyticus]TYP90844.1 2-keto-4-pentenoate hydratase/2-oxohepta-3-ene-1,7-dioic acid hydratase in catechol pathway [Blastococcus xanthinilyticus]
MRIVRYTTPDNSTPAYGAVEGEGDAATVDRLEGTPFDGARRTGERTPLAEVTLLAPVEPSKVVALGRNYAEHAKELGNEVPAIPIVFLKPSTAVVGPDADVPYPALTSDLHYEGELAVVIGKRCVAVAEEDVTGVVLGYTVANDLTMRDIQKSEGQWTRGKGFDGSCPLGPWVETEIDPSALSLKSTVNGELRQDGTTADMLRDVAACVSWVSQAMTLLPGDVVLTGTPAGVGSLQRGDEIAVTIEGIGTLSTRITG